MGQWWAIFLWKENEASTRGWHNINPETDYDGGEDLGGSVGNIPCQRGRTVQRRL